jgi:hypothetical protein
MTKIRDAADVACTLRAVLLGLVFAVAAAVSSPHGAKAQSTPIVYPSQGQSLEQQVQDESECRLWAQQQTGFNPAQGPANTGGGSSSGGGEVVRGAAGGAVLGAVGGAIAGDTGKGAAIGAGVGATAGLMRRGKQQQAEAQAQQQAANQYNQQVATYNRTFGTCMQGRGYAVN